MSLVQSTLGLHERLSPGIIRGLRKQLGFTVDYYYPITFQSSYGTDDANIRYGADPELSQVEVVSGIHSKRFNSDTTMDIYTSEEVMIYTTIDNPAPKDSKAVVHKGARLMIFRIAGVKIIPGVTKDIYKVFTLVPIS